MTSRNLCVALFSAVTLLNAQTPAAQVSRLNEAVANAQTVTPQVAALLTERAAMLSQLIATDPAAALQQALPPAIADRLRATAPPNSIETRGEFQGRLEDVIADDFANQRSQTRHYLRTATGSVEVFFSNQAPHRGDFVKISGLRLGDRMAVETVTPGDPKTIVANTVVAQAPCTTLGQQKIAVIMLTMPSNPTFPAGWTAASVQEAFFGSQSDTSDAQSLNGFWKEVSYGQTSATGQVFGPFALTGDYGYSTQSGLETEAINVADSTVDFSQFTHIALVFPNPSWGGFAADDSIGCNTISSPSKGNLQLSVGWFPAFPDSSPYVPTFDHELGHALGLNHSSSDDFGAIPLGPLGTSGTLTEYGDPFATMGSNNGHYAAEHKSILNWIHPGSDYLEVTAPGTYGILPYETTGNPRAIRVLRDPATSAWLWLEYRQPIGDIDKSIQQTGGNVFGGALVRYEDPTLDDLHTFLLDFNPVSTPNNFQTAALTPGTTWSDPNSLLNLTATSATAEGLNVTVGYDAPCATLQYSATTFPVTGGSGTVNVTAPSDCNWKAASNSSWLTISSGASGKGNGQVQFQAAVNTNGYQQNAEITVQRQSTRIIEMGLMTVLSVSPVTGSGDTGQFTFQFDHANGYQNISSSDIYFGGSSGCHVQVYLSGQYLWLLGDSGEFLGPLYLNAPGTSLSNSKCSVAATGSSISGSGTGAQITLQMNFVAGFAGTHRVSASVSDSGSSAPALALGMWTVPTVQQPGITIASNVPGAPFSLDGGAVYQSPATFYWSAGSEHTITWLSTVASQPGSRYVFQSWADGGANPRTISVPATSTTYTATLQAQYKLTLAASPANGGGAAATPISPDGYYNAGTVVSVTGTPATGYTFLDFSGDISSLMQTAPVTMSAPHNVTANFTCQIGFDTYPPGEIGAAASQGLLAFNDGGCAWTVSSNSDWLTLTGTTSGSGTASVIWTASANPGSTSRTAVISTSGSAISIQQDASTSLLPGIASVTPTASTGLSQAYTMSVVDPNGTQNISYIYAYFDPAPSDSGCNLSFDELSGNWYGYLSGSGASSGTLMTSTATLSNKVCTVSNFSFSPNGNFATLAFTVTFLPATPGVRYLFVGFSDSQDNQYSPYTAIAQLTVTPTAQTITFAPLPNIPATTTSVALSATASSGDPVAYTASPAAICTVSGATVTIHAAGGCSITATQPGDATYAAAIPVTQSFNILFNDTAPGDHYYAAINAMAQHGITNGCGSNNFCPGENVTRDQMAVFLVRAIYGNDNFTYNPTPYFTDVPSGAFGFKWIQKMKDLGITSGCTATTYCPSGTVNRDQMAIFIIRARLGLALAGGQNPTFTYPSTPYFTDVQPGAFGYDWIQRMRLENITSGCTATTYCASEPIIRGDMAIFIMRGALNLFLPAGTPMLTQISPATLPLGTSGTYTITGTNTNFIQGTTTISPIPGVTIGAITVTSPTTLTVQLTASSAATAQPYSILAVTGTEEDVLPNGLVLQ